ncbi:cytochrome c1 [methane-oxidizing endosymbiont of Gigantopelta aegis]|uniref:cytochrome c1 n=1 Tax=methane-oxidizing endosymbiont of Gigantopelta aegis TaxID=2794938 RepID=UPI0018DD1BF4|nr:cytochrome c1 [methane-oxidizing endosymbiont of Gigantopelta aegis]
MKKLLYILLLVVPFSVYSAGAEVELEDADIDLSDVQSLERGAKNYVTYCLGCHSAQYIRYKRIAIDLGLDEDKVLNDIAPLGAGIYDQMHSAMNPKDASKWFGTTPPDLSLIARVRGADWLYTYLKSFYTDPSRPYGVNNRVFEDVGMPNVLWQLQGEQTASIKKIDGKPVITKLIPKDNGKMSEKEFDRFVNDLVNFLVYIGEPVQLERKSMGKYVLFYILLFTIVAYLLKREYWKDIH